MSGTEPPIVPYLTVTDARAMLAFCEQAFGGKTVDVMEEQGGITHARSAIAGGLVMMFEERTGADPVNRAPDAYGGSSVALRLNLLTADAVDRTAAQAIAAGATMLIPPTDRPWGRLAEVRDPQGHIWRLAATAAQP